MPEASSAFSTPIFFFSSRRRHTRSVSAFLLNRSSDLAIRLLLSNRYKLITNVRSSLMAVNIHITIIELNALHMKRQNLFQELDAVIHLLMEAKHWGLRKSRNATSLNSRFKSLDTLKVKIISVTFRTVRITNHKKASQNWSHENIQTRGCQACRISPRQITANTISFNV